MHHFSRSPPRVVNVAIAHLPVKFVLTGAVIRKRFDEVIIDPLDVVEHFVKLPRCDIGITVFHHTPSQHGGRGCQREAEFHMVARVIEAACQIMTHIRPVVHGRIATPFDPIVGR